MELHQFYRNKRILVTGGSGFLATNLIQQLLPMDCSIVRLSRGTPLPDLPTVQAEIIDLTGVLDERSTWEQALEGVDIVFHFAAQTSTYRANDDPLADLTSNVVPMIQLLELCRQQQRPISVLFAGTVTAAGIPTHLPVDETHPDAPLTTYDVHKLAVEHYLYSYVQRGIVRGATLRLANIYGPGPRSSSSDRGILNAMIRKALKGEALTIYGEGRMLRDYLYIEDATRAFLAAGIHAEKLEGEHYVLGSGSGTLFVAAVQLVAERVARITGKRSELRHVAAPANLSPIETRNFVADTTRFSQATGWRAQVSLVEGIDRTIEQFLSAEIESARQEVTQ